MKVRDEMKDELNEWHPASRTPPSLMFYSCSIRRLFICNSLFIFTCVMDINKIVSVCVCSPVFLYVL